MHESSISTMLGFVVIVVIGLLIVNYFRQTDSEPTITDRAAIETQDGDEETHTVASGESLWTIAEEHYGDGFAWTRIVEANNLANANDIEEGQVLVIPAVTEVLAEATVSPEPTATAAATVTPAPTVTPVVTASPTELPEVPSTPIVSGDTYTVVRGDSLWNIAVKVYGDGYRWTDIAESNDLANPGIIHAGNVLTLPR